VLEFGLGVLFGISIGVLLMAALVAASRNAE
jgi:tetrahydromethanopterin S-methyltransferase subunit G